MFPAPTRSPVPHAARSPHLSPRGIRVTNLRLPAGLLPALASLTVEPRNCYHVVLAVSSVCSQHAAAAPWLAWEASGRPQEEAKDALQSDQPAASSSNAGALNSPAPHPFGPALHLGTMDPFIHTSCPRPCLFCGASRGRAIFSPGKPLACKLKTWRLQIKVLKAQVHSSHTAQNLWRFMGKQTFI